LTALAKKHRFLIFEDRKFADIGSTVQYQYRDGPFRIVNWAQIVNAHIVPGEGIVKGLEGVAREHQSSTGRGLVLLAEMSSEGTLATGEYTLKALEIARKHKSFVMGFIANGAIPGQTWSQEEDFITFTPGVNSAQLGDKLGQQYQTPDQAVKRGADILIVGRGIFGVKDPVEAAKLYQREGWEAYEKRVKSAPDFN
jgi:orotidine-5'-phosphate decarboxylase